ncbi:alpha/beta fold hydrolase [Arthrobacter sp. NPDC090010]|uniref:alpha/beta fold hydrolase n=1 Tax=Arthrobacter sp. NPDC090010 TaxID=3363942 RepID=UPI0038145F46
MEQTIQNVLTVDGASWVTVDVYGEPGTPGLLMVPGVMSDARSWSEVAAVIDAWPSVMVLNRRGRAPSGPLTPEYSVDTEVADLLAVLDRFGPVEALFGWSYGGLIALLAADRSTVKQVIAYEPVGRPFALDALGALHAAEAAEDWDRSVEIVNRRISGFSAEYVDELRADPGVWGMLRRFSEPLHAELAALNAIAPPEAMAQRPARVDLILGQRNRNAEPYGTAFEAIEGRVPGAVVHELAGQGHLAHLEDPAGLGRLINELALERQSTSGDR